MGDGPNYEEENRLVRVRTSNYEGPTTITYLIAQEAAKLGMETRAFVVHLPQYLQVDEDLTGTARLMEILCTLYHLPDRLIESQRGVDQYESLKNKVDDASGVESLLERLEERYDREEKEEQAPPPPLAPNIEEFLKDLGEDLDQPAS